MMKWTLEDSLKIIRAVQPETRRFGFHLCLGGGVLNYGESNKDLDLYFLPMDNGEAPDPKGMLEFLESLWGSYESIGSSGFKAYGDPWAEADGEHYTIVSNELGRKFIRKLSELETYSDASTSPYKFKVKFTFNGDREPQRIDVFILAGEEKEAATPKPELDQVGGNENGQREQPRPDPGPEFWYQDTLGTHQNTLRFHNPDELLDWTGGVVRENIIR